MEAGAEGRQGTVARSGLRDSHVLAEPVARSVVCPSSGNCLWFWYFFMSSAMVSELLALLMEFLIQAPRNLSCKKWCMK